MIAGFIRTDEQPVEGLTADLALIVGGQYVRSSQAQMRRYLRGFRTGQGDAIAVVLPGSLLELWKVLETCVRAGVIVIPQAANTGLTGGSTPSGSDYDRPVVVINNMRIKGIYLLGDGQQVVAFPGATLDELERALAPIGREPHSVIGSTCLGASVIGGVCNNSGGSLIRRGPAYTESALFARVNGDGELELVNNLGIQLGETDTEIMSRLDNRSFQDSDIDWTTGRKMSDHDYVSHVRDITSDIPARFNADPRKLHEVSGSAGKVMVFAVRLDTFTRDAATKVFYVGTNEPSQLTLLRTELLTSQIDLPIAAEYLDRAAFMLAEGYGKDTFLLVKWLGTRRLPKLFNLKGRIDAVSERVPGLRKHLSDRILQAISRCVPQHLPKRLIAYRDRFEHHLMLKVPMSTEAAVRQVLAKLCTGSDTSFIECSASEAQAAFLHRFATAGAAIRYQILNEATTGDLIALDVALPRNSEDWLENLPPEVDAQIFKKIYYGHFFCHVFHQDYLIHKDSDWLATKSSILANLSSRGGRYPAEHNVGHLYKADEILTKHYRNLDPCNCLNPGIGQTSKSLHWK
ncbi:D-lactate dehydrogenase [Neorhizobium galegae bv. officinalis]|nr:D-lactate dehydrogenase [Neorhizobium galegae bv. officinalis]